MATKFATLAATRQREKTGAPTNSPKRTRFRLRYVAVIVVLLWGGYQYFYVQRVQYEQLASKEQQLRTQLQSMQDKQTDLQRQAKELDNDTFIARYASQHFNLVMPGQVSFVVRH